MNLYERKKSKNIYDDYLQDRVEERGASIKTDAPLFQITDRRCCR